MTALGFLTKLNDLGVELSLVGSRLRYRAPEGILTPDLRNQMTRRKEELIDLLQQRTVTPRAKINSSGRYPLSPAQERLWFMDQLIPDSALYNESASFQLSGIVNIAALEQSLNEIVRRHEGLRTSFVTIEEQPYQIVSAATRIDLPLVDLSHLAEESRHDKARELAREQALRPFNLSRLPLVQARLISLSPSEHLMALTLHHIICDGWSKGIVVNELSQLYSASSRGDSFDLPEPSLQYADFSEWQRARIEGDALGPELEYWENQLGDSIPALDLADYVRPPVQSYKGAVLTFDLGPELSLSMKRFSGEQGVTLFMTLLAAWQVLLGRYSGQEELLIGTIVANRSRPEVQAIVGLMVNTLIIKCDLTGNPTFKEALFRLRDTVIGAYQNQEVPYENVVAEIAQDRDSSRNPITEVLVVMEEGLSPQVELEGLTLSEATIEIGLAKYDIVIALKDRNGKIECKIDYKTGLFDESKIRRISESYRLLLEAAITSPDCAIKDMPLLSASERRQLVEWNETRVEYDGYGIVHQMVERQQNCTPDAIAIVYEGLHLSYDELNRRANRLAHRLRALGVGPEKLVALCAERSPEMAVGLLAIMKAGGAYVPLDPAYPKERLGVMLKDARAGVLLAQKHLVGRLPEHDAAVVFLDRDIESMENPSDENPSPLTCEDNLVYVIYTSGSTGSPKGVCLTHRSLTNLIQWHRSTLISQVRMMQFASLSFDVSFYEMFVAWAAGGTLLIVPEDARVDIPRLSDYIRLNQIEKAILPVIVLQQLAEEYCFGEQPLATLKEVTTTGEQLQITKPVVTFFESFSQCALNNHYGPSETHVATAHHVSRPPSSWAAHPSIGKPIANTEAYVLDRNFNPVPVGVIGELFIGGVGLARGYLNRPDLTSERFIPNEFSKKPGECSYKTGDVVKHGEDGNIDYLGRADYQVKVRGFRVEPGEIESILNRHPAIREAVVVPRRESPHNTRLIAYVASDRSQKVVGDELRHYLEARLPAHMVPSSIVILERLPVTPNGKIDRAALMTNCASIFEEPEELLPPRTPAEELVASIWSDVLGVENVGITCNFFRLGGHSLLATQIILRLRAVFRVDLPVRVIFDVPTIDGLVKSMANIWGGREIVEEIAWTFMQVEQLSDDDARQILREMPALAALEPESLI